MSFAGNWIDLIILAVLLFFVSEAFRVGIWVILADFLSFLISLLISLRGYQITAIFLRNNFSLSHSVSNALGFLLTAILAEAVLGFLLARLLVGIPKKVWHHPLNRWLGIVPALGEGIVIIAFVLTLLMSFPISPSIKKDISSSRIGGMILQKTTSIEARMGEIFGGVIKDSLTYLTVKPKSDETVMLSIDTLNLSVDQKSEMELAALVNQERQKQGLGELNWDEELAIVARNHAGDMWQRRYFAHISPDGRDVGDRLKMNVVDFGFAGENLALAPTVETAHTGLMNSEGHRKNILEAQFKKVGIGAIDNGYYGKMFVQIFTD